MHLQPVQEKDKTVVLPRVNQEFIGLGHQLEKQRKQRRQIQLEHQTMQNRVLLLEKQQQKAKKNLLKKKRQLEQLMNIKQRQQYDTQEKAKIRQERMQQLERLKRQNQYNRLIHKSNYQNNLSMLRDRNHSDYSRIRQQRLDGQYSKRVKKDQDSQEKKDNWISINLNKQKGKMKIDQFYKRKNKQHIKEYQSRIMLQNEQQQSRINSIKDLQARQQSLRMKLQNSNMKNSKMQELIKSISRTLSPMNTRSIQAQLYGTSRAKKSSQTIDLSNHDEEKLITRMSSSDKDKMVKSKLNHNQSLGAEYIEENIEIGDDEDRKNGLKIVHRRKKNKHVNRYKQYQAY